MSSVLPRLAAIVCDLDGVIRRYPKDSIELKYERLFNMEPGTFVNICFAGPSMEKAVTGQLSNAAWGRHIAQQLADAGVSRSLLTQHFANFWSELGEVDQPTLHLVRKFRARVPFVLLTNGTDVLDSELTQLRLTDEFDAIVNTSELGFAKPGQQIYAHTHAVVEQLVGTAVSPDHVVFFDDLRCNTDAAQTYGWRGIQFTDADCIQRVFTEVFEGS